MLARADTGSLKLTEVWPPMVIEPGTMAVAAWKAVTTPQTLTVPPALAVTPPRYSWRCTVAGEKAGRQTAMYSAPPGDGVE